ncbi:sugar phosphate nucleotidyltransferase [Haloplanus rubicundus]|uniref:Nucleotidyl transferase domain-containing protein n=1 Tax=Haloplanus rubicundus TaxID=1547898 RepID=A0A345EBU8_9EURY|nr:hypothetical protein DU484_07225 [Haloplanus rubicundus]
MLSTRDTVRTLPIPLVPRWLRYLGAGASRLVLVVGYEADAVRSFFGQEFKGVPVDYAVQDHQRGTADAVRAGATALEEAPFAVLNGDNLYDSKSLTQNRGGSPRLKPWEESDKARNNYER